MDVKFIVMIIMAGLMAVYDAHECPSPSFSTPVLFDSVPLGDFRIRTYRMDDNKFHYAPLALLDHTSFRSGRNALTGENEMSFRVVMWNDELQEIVTEHLSNVTATFVDSNSVSILPFEQVIIQCLKCDRETARLASPWRSFAQSPQRMEFRLVCPTERHCADLSRQMSQHPEGFGPQFLLHFLLPSSSKQQSRVSSSIAPGNVLNGRIARDILERFSDAPHALVTLKDCDRIIEETLENNLVSDDDESILNPEDELRWKRRLASLLFDKVNREDEDNLEWNSVYNNRYPIKMDVLATKASRLYSLNDTSFRSLIAKALQKDIKDVDEDVIEMARWDGTRFVPKPENFLRIRLNRLRNSRDPFFNVTVKYFKPDLSLGMIVQPEMKSVSFQRNPQPPPDKKSLNNDDGSSTPAPRRSSGGFFSTIRTAITGDGLEIAPYDVLRTEEGYEERLYPARKWVMTQTKGISRDAASSTMFWKLFNYISGQNDKQEKIPMTAPVSVLIEPGSGPNCESTFTMAFYIPSAFQDNPPKPNNPDVSIEERPEFKAFSRTYGGFTSDRITAQEHGSLWTSLSDDDKLLADNEAPYYYAGYDPPFKLFYRRNEIWLIQGAKKTDLPCE